MDITNFTATKLKELLTVAVTSMVLGLVFAFVMCISNDADLDEYLSYMLLGGLSGFFISLGVVLFDTFYIKAGPHALIKSFTLIPALQTLIIVGMYSGIYSMVFGIETFKDHAYPIPTLIFSLVMTSGLNFFSDLERLLGKNVLRGLFFGKYKRPREENRFVMFLDISGSTSIAERIGDVRFHAFLNDFFCDIARPIVNHHGEIYKYVGDEVIITWPEKKGARDANAVRVYQAIRRALVRKTDQYELKYGFFPVFRCGLHFGPVVVGEMGLTRQEIAFSGDVMNTAARIQSECRPRNETFLASGEALDRIGSLHAYDFTITSQGAVPLRGKSREVAILALR